MTERKLRKLVLSSVPFETHRLIIRYISTDDSYDMYEYASVPEVTKYLLWSPHANLSATEGYIESLQNRYFKGLYADWAITLKDSGQMIGTIGYANIFSKEKACEIGYVLSPKYQKQGYMSEALEAIIDLTFNVFKFKKIILRVIRENAQSVKLANKFGFTEEYSLNMTIKDIDREVVHFTLSDKAYFAKKEAV